MNITKETKLSEILERYPWLREELPKVNEKYKMMNTPLGRMMIKKATIADVSKRSGTDEQVLIGKLTKLIEARE
ncbi:MAG: hypothetical protein ACOYJU_04995 [Anaerovoracaceae bacterium]|jgi:hypothetical protein